MTDAARAVITEIARGVPARETYKHLKEARQNMATTLSARDMIEGLTEKLNELEVDGEDPKVYALVGVEGRREVRPVTGLFLGRSFSGWIGFEIEMGE